MRLLFLIRFAVVFCVFCTLTGCPSGGPICNGGLCGKKVPIDRAMYVKSELVTAEPMEVPSLGKITVIDFWEACCEPCIKAMPSWEALWQRMNKTKAVMIGVSLDDDVDAARRSIRGERSVECPDVPGGGAVNVTFPMLYDGKARVLDAIYNVGITRPVTVVLNEKGVVIFDSRNFTGDAVSATEELLRSRGVLQ